MEKEFITVALTRKQVNAIKIAIDDSMLLYIEADSDDVAEGTEEEVNKAVETMHEEGQTMSDVVELLDNTVAAQYVRICFADNEAELLKDYCDMEIDAQNAEEHVELCELILDGLGDCKKATKAYFLTDGQLGFASMLCEVYGVGAVNQLAADNLQDRINKALDTDL